MSEAPPDRTQEMLARLAELDLAAAEKVHANLMAAEDASEIAQLGRTYQQLSRTVRQTLGLAAKLAREAEQHARWLEARQPPREYEPYVDPNQDEIDARVALLQKAGRLMLSAHFGAFSHRLERLERLEPVLDAWICEEEFLDDDFDPYILRACRLLGLPDVLAHTWRDLPDPADTLYPNRPHDPAHDPAAGATPPHRDTG